MLPMIAILGDDKPFVVMAERAQDPGLTLNEDNKDDDDDDGKAAKFGDAT